MVLCICIVARQGPMAEEVSMCATVYVCWYEYVFRDKAQTDRWRKNHCNVYACACGIICFESMLGFPLDPQGQCWIEISTGSPLRRRGVFRPPTRTESIIATLSHVQPNILTSTLHLRGAGSGDRFMH